MIHRFKTIDSTNTYAKSLAQQGAPHGTVVVAESQTGGRGRLGRSFHSPAGTGLYLSMILRPLCKADQLMHLTCAAAVAACDAIESATGLRPGIKWTNDIVCKGRKLGGILTELGFQDDLVDYAIIGIGINCNQSAADFPQELQSMAASLSMVLGKEIDMAQLEDALIRSLLAISQDNKATMLERYRTDCVTLGKEVCVLQGEYSYHATALDIDQNGGLLIRLPDGKIQTVSSGEVSVRGMYGYL